jgi:drug/metabolite transporter (DMT)-like permease
MAERKDRIDLAGGFWLVMFAGLMGINQVLVKLVNAGLAPIAQAGLRSICALGPVLLYAWWTRKRLSVSDGSLLPGILCGSLFAIEFMMMFTAFDYTSVSRATMLFYTMPFWLALAAHFFIPGERLTLLRTAGLALAISGVGWALAHNEHPATQYALFGDLLCIGGAMCWAGIALTARLTNLSKSSPEMQLVYQLAVSSVILLPVAALSGPMLREFTPAIGAMFAFQVLVVVAFGFLMWFRVLAIYPASDMASFGFLTPLFGVAFGWLILGEKISWGFAGALALVCVGIVLVNRKRKAKVAAVKPG